MEGAHFVIIPNAIKSIFGQEADKIYSILFSYSGISALLMLLIVTSTFGGNYESVFQFSSILSLTAFIILTGVFKEKQVKVQTVNCVIDPNCVAHIE